MKLGIGSYTFMWSIGFSGSSPLHPMGALDLMCKGIELGVHVVQFGPNLALDSLPESELAQLLAFAAEKSIDIEIGTRGLTSDHLARQIELCRRCGAKLLRTTAESEDGAVLSIPEMRRCLRAIIPSLETAKIGLAIENGRIAACDVAAQLDELKSRWVGVTLDTVNSLAIPEGTKEVVNHLARHTLCLHVKDFVVQRAWHMMGFTVEGRPAGEGQMGLSWILEQLKKEGSDPNAILELWPPPQTRLDETIALEHAWAESSVRYLRKHIPN